MTFPQFWLSVDPGDFHVGVAVWRLDQCVDAFETSPDDFVDQLIGEAGELKLVVCESWTLYPQMHAQMVGSEFLTCQLIGAIRHVCRRAQIPCLLYSASQHKPWYKSMDCKAKPLRSWKSYGHGVHAKDAENIGLYHLRQKHRQLHGW